MCVFHTDPSNISAQILSPTRRYRGGVRPPLGFSELTLPKDSASSSYLERERLSSHYAARGPGALRSWTPQVLTLLRRQSVGKGPHQAPKLVGVGVGGGKKEKKSIKMHASPSRAAKNRVWETTLGTGERRLPPGPAESLP